MKRCQEKFCNHPLCCWNFSAVISSSLLLYLKIQSNWQRLWDLQLGFKDEFQNSLSLEKPFLHYLQGRMKKQWAWISIWSPREWTAKGLIARIWTSKTLLYLWLNPSLFPNGNTSPIFSLM